MSIAVYFVVLWVEIERLAKRRFACTGSIFSTSTCIILHYIKRIIYVQNLVRTVVFNVGNVRHTNKAGILHSVDPEQQVYKCAVYTRHGSREAAHVVVMINESNSKPWCRVQRDTHAPYVSLRSDARNCTYWRNGVAYLQQYITCSKTLCSPLWTTARVKHLHSQLMCLLMPSV